MPDATAFSFSFFAAFAFALPLGAQDSSARARQLFVANCASCHGETGDGKGTAQLDRPARSFKDGGFSFGNTPEALFRTISVGIPGSPMAGFDTSLSEEDRKLVAAYVVTLGPPIEEVKVEDTILAVHDRPLVVRGLLPPLAEGLPAHPRGLLIGDPSGITFEYTVDDVRLLGLRQGGFVERTDWSGRDGTALNPLGKVVYMVEGGKPDALFSLAGSATRLSARLSGTRVDGGVMIDYHLVSDGREVAHVEEMPSVASLPFGTGYERSFVLIGGASRARVALVDPTQGSGEELFAKKRTTKDDPLIGTASICYSVRKGADGGIECRSVLFDPLAWSREGGVAAVDLAPGQRTRIAIGIVPLGEWNDAVRAQIEELR